MTSKYILVIFIIIICNKYICAICQNVLLFHKEGFETTGIKHKKYIKIKK